MTDGVYNDVTIEQYLSNTTHLSSTQVRTAKESLKKLDWTRRGLIKQDSKSHFDFGNAFELALMSQVEFSEKVAIKKDGEWVKEAMEINPAYDKPRSSKHYQEANAKFIIENKGRYHINDTGKESYETIKHMLESCYQDKVIKALVTNIEYQLTVFWTDPQTGLKLKTRPDICKRKKNILVNIKTTEDGSPKNFSREIANYDYPMQAAHEITGILEMGVMDSVDNYFWLVIEKVPPYHATIYDFSEQDIRVCVDELHWTYERIAKAEKQNFFPGYSDRADNQHGILTAQIPVYYRM